MKQIQIRSSVIEFDNLMEILSRNSEETVKANNLILELQNESDMLKTKLRMRENLIKEYENYLTKILVDGIDMGDYYHVSNNAFEAAEIFHNFMTYEDEEE